MEAQRKLLNLMEGEDEMKKSWDIIENSSPRKLNWDFLIIVFAIFNTCTIPVAIAFNPPWATATWYRIIDTLLNVFYFADIGVQFSTSFVSVEGFVVYDRK